MIVVSWGSAYRSSVFLLCTARRGGCDRQARPARDCGALPTSSGALWSYSTASGRFSFFLFARCESVTYRKWSMQISLWRRTSPRRLDLSGASSIPLRMRSNRSRDTKICINGHAISPPHPSPGSERNCVKNQTINQNANILSRKLRPGARIHMTMKIAFYAIFHRLLRLQQKI